MRRLINIWGKGNLRWTEVLDDDGQVAIHCEMTQLTAAEVAQAYRDIPLMQQQSHHPLAPFRFSLASDDPMILAIAQEHGVLVQPCPR